MGWVAFQCIFAQLLEFQYSTQNTEWWCVFFALTLVVNSLSLSLSDSMWLLSSISIDRFNCIKKPMQWTIDLVTYIRTHIHPSIDFKRLKLCAKQRQPASWKWIKLDTTHIHTERGKEQAIRIHEKHQPTAAAAAHIHITLCFHNVKSIECAPFRIDRKIDYIDCVSVCVEVVAATTKAKQRFLVWNAFSSQQYYVRIMLLPGSHTTYYISHACIHGNCVVLFGTVSLPTPHHLLAIWCTRTYIYVWASSIQTS